MNINSKDYWDKRFGSGDWDKNKGKRQTQQFTQSQIPLLNISKTFSGTILDFGCGQGDSLPILKNRYQSAKLIGLDISEEGVKIGHEKYENIANFICGDYLSVPNVDIIIASNVFEHLSDDTSIANHLLKKCSELFIFVPYKEKLSVERNSEHVNSYDENYYNGIGKYKFTVFPCKGWSQFGPSLWFGVYLGNVIRKLLGRELRTRRLQICFHFSPLARE